MSYLISRMRSLGGKAFNCVATDYAMIALCPVRKALCNCFRLAREVYEIRESVRYLKDKLRSSEIQMARLMKTKSQLENDICVKENSLAIDGKACMGLRKTFPSDGNSGPIFNMPLVR